jgi:hypothetical protein
VRKSGDFLGKLGFPSSCGDRTVGSAVEERTLDLASVRYCEKYLWLFSRGSVPLVRAGIERHPERWSWRLCAASCSLRKTWSRALGNLEFNLPLVTRSYFVEQYFMFESKLPCQTVEVDER